MSPVAIPGTYLGGMDYVPAQTSSGDPTAAASSAKQNVIDGTPARVAALGIVSLAILVGLRYSGLRFNVAVGN